MAPNKDQTISSDYAVWINIVQMLYNPWFDPKSLTDLDILILDSLAFL